MGEDFKDLSPEEQTRFLNIVVDENERNRGNIRLLARVMIAMIMAQFVFLLLSIIIPLLSLFIIEILFDGILLYILSAIAFKREEQSKQSGDGCFNFNASIALSPNTCDGGTLYL